MFTLFHSTFLRSNLWCSTLDCCVLFWTLNNVSPGLHESISFGFYCSIGHLDRLIQKGFFWRFILFLKSPSVWKVLKPLKVVFYYLFCCVEYCSCIVLRYCSCPVVWAAVLNYAALCCVLCCFMLVYVCVIMCICLHQISLIYQLFLQDIKVNNWRSNGVLKRQFCHPVFILMSFQTCVIFNPLWNTKEDSETQ